MAPVFTGLSHLANPLASPDQLALSSSSVDGIPADLEDSLRYAGARLTQAAGTLLKLPQDVIAQAIVIFSRFWIGSEGGSLVEYGVQDVSAASVYLAAKLSILPKPTRSIVNVYSFLEHKLSTSQDLQAAFNDDDASNHHVSEGTYQISRENIMRIEAHILRTLGFQTHVATPYALCINYLQALDVVGKPRGAEVAKRAFAYLNTALLSPQLLFLTHQPPSLATTAIYLAARDVGKKLPDGEWWEVFDTEREELGFLAVGMLSVEGFVASESVKWGDRRLPLTVDQVKIELEHRHMLESHS
ncbi:MAG: hypothetical protein M1820_005549 [Bogoriella megaspora]|nr:MAG: hypothetical protein M1820_005549 [Bogoriella megaspora]